MTLITDSNLTLYRHWLGGYTALWSGKVFRLVYLGAGVWAVNTCRDCRGNTPRRAAEAYILHRYGVKP